MAQYLRISKQSKSDEKGRYLQTYENNHVQGKGTKSKFVKTPGYEKDIMASGIEDPVAHYRKLCKKQNEKDKKERENKKLEKITNECTEKNVGYFLVRASSITFASYICCIYALEFGQFRTSFWCGNSSVPDTPYMQFLFVKPRFCLWVSMSPHIRLPSDSTSRWTPLSLANSSYCQVCSGLSPPSNRACRAHGAVKK